MYPIWQPLAISGYWALGMKLGWQKRLSFHLFQLKFIAYVYVCVCSKFISNSHIWPVVPRLDSTTRFSLLMIIGPLIRRLSSVQSLSHVRLFVTLWISARHTSLSITNSRSSLRLTSIESVMPSSHLILGHPFLLLPSSPPSIRVFSNESTLRMRWPKYWSSSFSIIPSKEILGLSSFRME